MFNITSRVEILKKNIIFILFFSQFLLFGADLRQTKAAIKGAR